jgi:hypothetical protein
LFTCRQRKLKGLGVQEESFTVDTGGHAAFHYGVVAGPGGEWPGPLIRWLEKIEMAGKSLK